jgi:RNA polymerase sigma-70 factor (ECF subfamily)
MRLVRPITTGTKMVIIQEERLKELFVQGLAGDARAYHDFLKTLTPRLRAYFRKRLIRLPNEVEDLVQEVLLAVHNNRHTYLVDQPVTAWVYAIARYKMVDMMRRHAIRDSLHDSIDNDMEFPEIASEDSTACRDITKLLLMLPDKQRLPIQYVKLEGMSVVEAAQRTGLTESAVKVGVHRGLKVLAAKMRGIS